MIKNDASVSEVNSKIDTILENMKVVEVAVPEFGIIMMAVLFIAIIGIIAVTKKTRLTSIPRL
jgi:predicted secreted protein with PEFG-CTERM motif